MVIWPEGTSLTDAVEAGAWCISRTAAAEFVDASAPTRKCLKEARDVLRALCKEEGDEHALSALVEAVVKFAPELLLMPLTSQTATEEAFPEAI